jgi:hypothetical protein
MGVVPIPFIAADVIGWTGVAQGKSSVGKLDLSDVWYPRQRIFTRPNSKGSLRFSTTP